MRVLLNLKHLLEQKLITSAEAGKMASLAAKATFQFAVSILMIFGILAVAGGIFSMQPETEMLILLGVLILGLGMVFDKVKGQYSWALVSFVTLVLGAILTAAGIGTEFDNIEIAALVSALLFIVVAIAAHSGFLAALSALTLAVTFGGGTSYGDYGSGSYFLGLESRALAIVVFIILGSFAFQWAKRLKADNERIAVIFARMSLIIVNIGFWIGSLFGDTVGKINYEGFSEADYDSLYNAGSQFLPSIFGGAVLISADFFAVLWAVAIVLTGIWAVRVNSVFTLNVVATFAAIHFYTQWFERFGAEPWSLLIAGGIAVLIAFGLSFINGEKGNQLVAFMKLDMGANMPVVAKKAPVKAVKKAVRAKGKRK